MPPAPSLALATPAVKSSAVAVPKATSAPLESLTVGLLPPGLAARAGEDEAVGAGVGGGGVAVGVLGGRRQVVDGADGRRRRGRREDEFRRCSGGDRDRRRARGRDRALGGDDVRGSGLVELDDTVFGRGDGGDAGGEADRGRGPEVGRGSRAVGRRSGWSRWARRRRPRRPASGSRCRW